MNLCLTEICHISPSGGALNFFDKGINVLIVTASCIPRVSLALDTAFQHCSPDIVLYNAGTDILDGDPLGR